MPSTDAPLFERFRLSDLPVDIVHSIISHLQYNNSTLDSLSKVAKSWHELATPYLYRHIDIRDPSMSSQLLFQSLITTETNSIDEDDESNARPPFSTFVQSLGLGVCPSTHARGDFIYCIPNLLSKLSNLRRLELVKTEGETRDYWIEGNSNSLLHRFARGEITNPLDVISLQMDPHVEPKPNLTMLRIDLPIGPTLLSILNAQKPYLQALEVGHPQSRYSVYDFIPPTLKKLAICGENAIGNLGSLSHPSFEPTHLSLDYTSTTPLWPSTFRRSTANYLSFPSTEHLRSLEVSTTLVPELSSQVNSSIKFPSLVHFGTFTPRLAEERFLQERQFLMMWTGKKYDPKKEMKELFRHFGGLRTLTIQPEGVNDWMDMILVDEALLVVLKEFCPGIRFVMWRSHGEKDAGAIRFEGDTRVKVDMDAIDIFEYWKTP